MNTSLFADKTRYDSRGEADFAFWCKQRKIKFRYKPDAVAEMWLPDFELTGLNVRIEIKAPRYWYETEKAKRAVEIAIGRGERFWTWLVYMDWGLPIVRELTAPNPDQSDSFAMGQFVVSDEPAEYWQASLRDYYLELDHSLEMV